MGIGNEMKNIQQKTAEMNGDKKLIWLDPHILIDDEKNEEFYGNFREDVDTLAQSIMIDGFDGVIIAYKVGDEYHIKAGHRRKYAAIKAELKSVPVVLVKAPKTEYERIIGLLDSNNNKRDDTPMILAKTAAAYFDVIQDRRKNDEEYAEKVKGIPTKKLVADKMGKSASTVSFYASLLKLIPELQEKANSEKYAWSAFIPATSLDTEKQKIVNEIIDYEVTEHESEEEDAQAYSKIDKAFIQNIINELKEDMFNSLEEYKCLTIRQQKVDEANANIEVYLHETDLNNDHSENLIAKEIEESSRGISSTYINNTDPIQTELVEESSSGEINYNDTDYNDISDKTLGDYTEPKKQTKEKSNRTETIRSRAILLTSLIEEQGELTEEELKYLRGSLIGLRSAISTLID